MKNNGEEFAVKKEATTSTLTWEFSPWPGHFLNRSELTRARLRGIFKILW